MKLSKKKLRIFSPQIFLYFLEHYNKEDGAVQGSLRKEHGKRMKGVSTSLQVQFYCIAFIF